MLAYITTNLKKKTNQIKVESLEKSIIHTIRPSVASPNSPPNVMTGDIQAQ